MLSKEQRCSEEGNRRKGTADTFRDESIIWDNDDDHHNIADKGDEDFIVPSGSEPAT